MKKRSMSVLGDAVMMAAAASERRIAIGTAHGGESGAGTNEQDSSPAAEIGGGVSGATSENPEPLLVHFICSTLRVFRCNHLTAVHSQARGALVRKGLDDELVECRPLFTPMRSNARGSADHPGMEPTVLINTSFISQIDGQSAKVEASASTASGANVAKFVQDHRALILNFFRLEFQDSEYVGLFRRAVGLPWYTTITLALLTLLMATGATLLACVQYQVAAAKQGLDALHAAEPYPPDFSDQVIAVHVDHQYITPGLNARYISCVASSREIK